MWARKRFQRESRLSVINIIRQTHAIHIITDGITEGPSGDRFNVSKVMILPSLNAAIALNGRGVALGLFAAAINERCQSRDDLERNAADAVREIVAPCRQIIDGGFKMTIAGWDERGTFSYGMSDGTIFGRPWVLNEQPRENVMTLIPFEQKWVPAYRKVVPRSDADGMDVDKVAVQIVLLQRRLVAGGDRSIGGLVSRITIDKDGATSRIIRRFPEHLERSAA